MPLRAILAMVAPIRSGGLAAALAPLARDRGEHALKAQVLIYPKLDPRARTTERIRNERFKSREQ
jgi:acetyl esterase/lipase